MNIKKLSNKNIPSKVFYFDEEIENTSILDKLKIFMNKGELSFKEIKAITVKLDGSHRGFWVEFDNDTQYLFKIEVIKVTTKND